ncbi:MAG: hypothetical protein LBC90_06785 [Candidatus Adiutrix sp.]|jgi:hypothetical protein|nr:hypothetical protein [Candidatus Adiutrix sp.]
MSEIKRRIKKDPPLTEEGAEPPRRTRVTLTKDVSSRYRKLVPRAEGSAKPRPPRSKNPAARPERDDRPKRGGPQKPPRRRDTPPPRSGRLPEALKALIDWDLPEAARQLRETQALLRNSAEEMLTLLEDWENRPPEETKDPGALVSVLFEKMSFQDLAGQRLAKVEKFLQALKESTQPGASADRFRPRQAEPFSKTRPAEPFSKAAPAGASETRPVQDSPREEKSLKGPQAPESRLAQNEVDQILMALLLR